MSSLTSPKSLGATAQKTSGLTVRADWQLGCSELKQRGGHLLQMGNWADCSFLVGAEPHQMLIKAHKLILASASPVFEAMFYGGMAERDGPIRVLDIHPEAFKTLLLYIYTDRTIIPSFDKACMVYYASKKYMLPYLEKECSWFISLNLDAQNVCRAYELAQLFDENLLMEKCLKVIEARTREVVTVDSFLEIDISTLNTVLSLEHLSIESELDLFNAIEKYAKVHFKGFQLKRRSDVSLSCSNCSMKRIKMDIGEEAMNCSADRRKSVISITENNLIKDTYEPHKETEEQKSKNISEIPPAPCKINTTNAAPDLMGGNKSTPDVVQTNLAMEDDDTLCDDDSTISNVSSLHNDISNTSQALMDDSGIADRETLREAIGKIRFLTLTATQFASGPARSPLLSESEAFAVLMNILSSASDVPMPTGFSTCRLPRNQQTLAPEVAERRCEAVFRFTVLNFKSRRRSVESRPFLLHDAPWTLRLLPRLEADTAANENKYIALYLRCTAKKDTQFAFKVKAEIRMLAQQPQKPDIVAEIKKVFTNASPEWGVERFVEWSSALSAERALLRNNALVLEARVRADRLDRAEPAEPAPAH